MLFTTPELLKDGRWAVIGEHEPLPVNDYFDMEALEPEYFIGVTIYGAGIVEKFLNAYFGMHPWNGFYKPDYLDEL